MAASPTRALLETAYNMHDPDPAKRLQTLRAFKETLSAEQRELHDRCDDAIAATDVEHSREDAVFVILLLETAIDEIETNGLH